MVTGSNHAAGISNDNKLYVWGFNSIQNRLGLKDRAEEINARTIPLEPKALLDVLQEAKDEKGGEQALRSVSDAADDQEF